jgi:hypothetical protein
MENRYRQYAGHRDKHNYTANKVHVIARPFAEAGIRSVAFPEQPYRHGCQNDKETCRRAIMYQVPQPIRRPENDVAVVMATAYIAGEKGNTKGKKSSQTAQNTVNRSGAFVGKQEKCYCAQYPCEHATHICIKIVADRSFQYAALTDEQGAQIQYRRQTHAQPTYCLADGHKGDDHIPVPVSPKEFIYHIIQGYNELFTYNQQVTMNNMYLVPCFHGILKRYARYNLFLLFMQQLVFN